MHHSISTYSALQQKPEPVYSLPQSELDETFEKRLLDKLIKAKEIAATRLEETLKKKEEFRITVQSLRSQRRVTGNITTTTSSGNSASNK